MLTFFPTPYPDEWWYSVICRYYVHSSRQEQKNIVDELYDSGDGLTPHSVLIPNRTISNTIKKLPPGLLDFKHVLLEHTLFPYYTRFFSEEKIEEYFTALEKGNSMRIRNVVIRSMEGKEGLYYCPDCYREDIEKYGEPYWRRAHQIPSMSICLKHQRRLVTSEIRLAELKKRLIPLASMPCQSIKAELPDWEIAFNHILLDFLEMPVSTRPTKNYNNLITALLISGYQSKIIKKRACLDYENIFADSCKIFGEETVRYFFRGDFCHSFQGIDTWKAQSPEKYAMLAVLSGIDANILFGEELKYEDFFIENLKKLSEDGQKHTKKQAAELLNVNYQYIEYVVQKYGLTPFWQRRAKSRNETLTFHLTGDEKKQITNDAKEAGFDSISEYIRNRLLDKTPKI